MFSNLSVSINDNSIRYPILDGTLSFAEYIAKSKAIIEERRIDIINTTNNTNLILDANCPFELYPQNPILSGRRLKYGALLIHGLLDSPFSLRDIGTQLQANGILSRAILLPGHGTLASDLLHVSYHDWLQAVHYGIESLRKEVDNVFLIGYSTGAALSIYHALQNEKINGIILLSPAIRIKAPVNLAVAWHKLTKLLSKNQPEWMYQDNEIDYAKYQSITFNSIKQVSLLTNVIRELRQQRPLINPIFMVVSREDETISSHHAINFFSNLSNEESRLLLYSSIDHRYPDPRITTRLAHLKDLGINHCSHVAIPFASTNPHYGREGDYLNASRMQTDKIIYGAYNRAEEKISDLIYLLRLAKCKRRELTYNPDFDNMSKEIVGFITSEKR